MDYWHQGTVSTVSEQSGSPKVDGLGNILLPDFVNRCLQRIDAQGQLSIVKGTKKKFKEPLTLVVAKDDTMFASGRNCIWKISPQGEVSFLTGDEDPSSGGFEDGPLEDALFDGIQSLALASDGSLLVADCNNHRIRKVSLTAGVVTTLAGNGREGHADGSALEASFTFPDAILPVANGELLVAERGQLRKINSKGVVSTVMSKEANHSIADLIGDCRGNLIFSELEEHAIYFCTPQCVVTKIAGNGKAEVKDGPSADASFDEPDFMVLDFEGRVVVSDTVLRALSLPSTKRLQAELSSLAGSDLRGFAACGEGTVPAPPSVSSAARRARRRRRRRRRAREWLQQRGGGGGLSREFAVAEDRAIRE